MFLSRKLSLILSFYLGVVTRTGREHSCAKIVLISQHRSRDSLSLPDLEKVISCRFTSIILLHVAFDRKA